MRHQLAQLGARKLQELAAAASAPAAMEQLRRCITEGDDVDCYKIDPWHFAEVAGVARPEALRVLLLGARAGVLELTWDLRCMCGGVPTFRRRLAQLPRETACDHCSSSVQADLEANVEVSFTVDPDVRPLTYADFRDRDNASQERYLGDMRRRLRPGRERPIAAHVLMQQDFRDLFPLETLAEGTSYPLHDATFLFSDLGGTTDLCEALGDERAFELVRDRLALITAIVRRHEGGVVKTAGDAVMAVFPTPGPAVRAALEMRATVREKANGSGAGELRMGLHRGPARLVTSNHQLDFFGRTVNVAARVRSEAKPNQLALSDALLLDSEARRALDGAGLPRRPYEAKLHGIRQPVTVVLLGG